VKSRYFILAAATRRESGRTLIELLIAIVLSLMILAAVGSLYYFTSQSARTSQQVSSAEERGRIAAFHLSEPIALAGYGNINSSEMGPRLGNTAMRGPPIRACENGRFQNMPSVLQAFPNVDFTCVPSADPGDALYVSFQAESTVGAPQGALTDCLGQVAPVIDATPTVRNVYTVSQTAGGALEFGCVGNGGVAFAGLARDVQDFKVFFAWDSNAWAFANNAEARHTIRPSQIVTATFLNNAWAAVLAANPNLPDATELNPWNWVMAVHVCLVVASSEQGVTADGVSRFRPCPTTPAEVAGGTAEITLNDGVARRTINQVFTMRSRAQSNAGTNLQ
jgi:type II secretory pathway pseudopilin PulG